MNLPTASDAAPILVIAPLRVARSTWPDEIRESVDLIHIKHSLICGPVEEREAALAADADVYITNFEQIPWLVKRMRMEPRLAIQNYCGRRSNAA